MQLYLVNRTPGRGQQLLPQHTCELGAGDALSSNRGELESNELRSRVAWVHMRMPPPQLNLA